MAGCWSKLLAAVRPEFRVEVYLPAPDDPVLGRPPCAVPGCDRSGWEYGLCGGHSNRWRSRGRPELAGFLADPGPPLHGRIELTALHGARLPFRQQRVRVVHAPPQRLGRAAATPTRRPGRRATRSSIAVEHAECGLPFCTLWCENDRHLFCKSHETRWRQLGRPAVEDYVAHCLLRGRARIDFRGLAPQPRLELQYAVQCRHDQQTITAAATGRELGDQAGQRRRGGLAARSSPGAMAGADRGRSPAAGIRGSSCTPTTSSRQLREGTGWEVEYPRDVWRLHTLPGLTRNAGKAHDARNHLRFDRITQPWLRALAKRWARLRLSSRDHRGHRAQRRRGPDPVQRVPRPKPRPPSTALAGIDRPLLERYLAWLATQPVGHGAKEDAVTGVHLLFSAIRQHGWDDTLPDHRGVLRRRHPAPPTAALAPAQRARHGPDRSAGQPGPLGAPRRAG